jgi:hypothetical protein
MDKSLDGKIKLQLIIAGGIEPIVEWTVNVHLDNQKKATGITLITKKTEL